MVPEAGSGPARGVARSAAPFTGARAAGPATGIPPQALIAPARASI
jgi:hypothetical protein